MMICLIVKMSMNNIIKKLREIVNRITHPTKVVDMPDSKTLYLGYFKIGDNAVSDAKILDDAVDSQ